METITSLERVSFETLYATFKEAFGDYEMQVNKNELQVMLSRRGFDASLSFGLFEDDELKSFIFNGVGNFKGKKTAYDSGTGTLKECRGKGYASKIFTYSLPYLRRAGVSQYLLEVLQHNTGAYSVYKKLGFEVSREFSYFVQEASQVRIPERALASGYEIREISAGEISGIGGLGEFGGFGDLGAFGDFAPSWQNSNEAIARRAEDFRVFVAMNHWKPAGYCIFDPVSGDVTQIAVAEAHRRKGIASALLNEALKANRHTNIKIVNTEPGCTSITDFLASCGITPKGKQFEMIMRL